MHRPVLAAVAAILALSACGSTVAPSAGGQLAGPDGLVSNGTGELGGPATGSLSPDGTAVAPGGAAATGGFGALPPGADPATAAAAGGAVPGGGAAAPGQAPGGAGPTGTTAGGAGLPTSGRGFTPTSINIGFGVLDGGKELASALGLPLDSGDTRAMVRALVADFNATGGVAGRKIKLVEHVYKAEERFRDANTSAQAACEGYSQDNQVFAVVDNVVFNDVLISCLAGRNVPSFGQDYNFTSSAQYAKHPQHMFSPTTTTADRMVGPWSASLRSAGYYGAWDADAGRPGGVLPVKVGLFYSKNDGQQLGKALIAQMRREGLPFVAYEHSDPGRDGQAAVLKFRSEKVTHLMTDTALGAILFGTSAKQQNDYRPRHAFTSLHNAGGVLESGLPREQLAGAVGAGWAPVRDVSNANDPGDLSAFTKQCREIMRKAGLNPSNRQHWGSMLVICDQFNGLRTALKGASGLSVPSMVAALERSSYTPAGLFRQTFRPGQHDAAARLRTFTYVADCSCFRYAAATKDF